jgi:hypothetical protein
MSFLRYEAHPVSGNANGITAGNQVDGNEVFIGGGRQKAASLSATVTCEAETNTLTFTAKWQGSNDKTTWRDVANGPQNPAGVVLATGTGGDDAEVIKVIPAPPAIEGFKFARCSLVVGVATGAVTDTYTIAYNYRDAARR